MALNVKEQGGNFKRQLIPEGVHIARCYLMVDIGTQLVTWQTETHERHKVVIGWEIPGELGTFTIDEKEVELPLCISKTYTATLSKKGNLRSDLEAWRGKAFTKDELDCFDLKNVLGAACQMQVIHNSPEPDKVYNNISALMAVPKGMPVVDPVTPVQYYSMDEGMDVIPENIPNWLVEKIHASKEWIAEHGTEHPTEPEPTPASAPEPADDDGLENEQLPF